MNLQPHQAGDLAGINGHNLRRPGHTSASIDPALSAHNYMLDRSAVDWTPPAVQPDTGRKIRADARVVASFVMTLPEEIDPKDGPKVDAWIDATMDWWDSLPGKPAYAVMHMDEPGARPHIHALRIPVNEAGNLNYKRDFGGHRERLDEMHESYALALEPLGVFMAHEDDRKKRRSARKEPEEPGPAHRPGRRRPKTRSPETPRAELEAENKRLRDALKASGKATREDYMELAEIKKSDLKQDKIVMRMGEVYDRVMKRVAPEADPKKPDTTPEQVPTITGELLLWQTQERNRRKELEEELAEENKLTTVTGELETVRTEKAAATGRATQAENENRKLVEANRTLRQRLKDSGQARQEDYQEVRRFMTDSTLTKTERVKAATAYVDERTAYSAPPTPADLVDVDKAVTEPVRDSNAAPSLVPVIEELIGEKEKRQKAESAAAASKRRVEVVEKALPETGWTMPRVKTRKETKIFRPDQRVETERASQYRHRVGQEIDLYLSKQRRADKAALEEEKQQAREQAAAAAETNVQQELQRLQDQETRYLTLQGDHQTLEKTNTTLVTERNSWKKKYEDLVVKVEPYLDALKQLPEYLVSRFNGFLSNLAELVKTKDREKGQGIQHE